jgi:hypothetical protein
MSLLWKFPFLVHKLLVRHILDLMHCEKNVCENILNYLLGEKDKPQVRNDMQRRGIRSHLHLRPLGNSGNAFRSKTGRPVRLFHPCGTREINTVFYMLLACQVNRLLFETLSSAVNAVVEHNRRVIKDKCKEVRRSAS